MQSPTPNTSRAPEATLIPPANPVPFNLWASQSNALFYKHLDDPLRAFRTLGSADTLLPRAFAQSISHGSTAPQVHEIGSGNFFFAKKVIESAPSIERYNTYDFSDSSFKAHGHTLPKEIAFANCSALQVPAHIREPGSHIVGVELCDDLPNEFWTYHEGSPWEMWMDIAVDSRLNLPHLGASKIAQVGVPTDMHGDSSLPELTAERLSKLITQGEWEELHNYNAGLLNALHYQTRQFMPTDLNSIYNKGWKIMPPEFRATGDQILDAYRTQLASINEFGQVAHLPTAAIALLWRCKDLPRPSTVHFFDYGYETPASKPAAFMTFQGQVSVPVNFGLLKTAAELMGYRVTLEKDRELIQRVTGEDTLIVGRIQGLDLHILGEEMETALLLGLFGDAAQKLSPDAEVSPSTIRGLRVPRAAAEAAAAEVQREYTYKDGSYYFRAELIG